MPIYEYVAEEDGEVIELMRTMAEADEPVADPADRGRTFRRRMSTFAPKAGSTTTNGSTPLPMGGCPCGNPNGPCNS
jgi:predicted nucleic acid-binding Zn ribbon protein